MSAVPSPGAGRADRPAPRRSASRFDGHADARGSRRHAGLGAARQRRAAGRAVVQVPPAARHPDGRAGGAERAGRAAATGARREPNTRATMAELLRRAGGDEPEPLAVARLRRGGGERAAGAVPVGAGFYYKTFMWPAAFWEQLYEPLIRRAAGLGRAERAARPRPLREGLRASATCWWSGGGPAGLMAALAAGRAGARVILVRRGLRARAGGCSPDGGEIDGRARASTGSPRRWRSWSACRTCACCAARTVFGVYDGGTYGAVERVAEHLAAPPAHQPRQRFWRIVGQARDPGGAGRSSGRSCSAATTGRA